MSDLERLLRWETSGGTLQVLAARGDERTISLCRCDGGEEADRLVTSDPDAVAYVDGLEPDA